MENVVTVSSSETDSHSDLFVLELVGYSISPHLIRNMAHEASFDSSTASDWFDTGLVPESCCWPRLMLSLHFVEDTIRLRPIYIVQSQTEVMYRQFVDSGLVVKPEPPGD
jgi:hypothetical protein